MFEPHSDVPVLGFAAVNRNSGKTTLIEKLIPLLARQSIQVSVLKHVHHDIDMDTPGKDSYRFRSAGAYQVMTASSRRSFLQTEIHDPAEYPDVAQFIALMDHKSTDLVLVEGFRTHSFPRIEVTLEHSSGNLLCHDDDSIIAVASKHDLYGLAIPTLPLDEPLVNVDFILNWLNSNT